MHVGTIACVLAVAMGADHCTVDLDVGVSEGAPPDSPAPSGEVPTPSGSTTPPPLPAPAQPPIGSDGSACEDRVVSRIAPCHADLDPCGLDSGFEGDEYCLLPPAPGARPTPRASQPPPPKPAPPAPTTDEPYDPGVERFRRLELD